MAHKRLFYRFKSLLLPVFFFLFPPFIEAKNADSVLFLSDSKAGIKVRSYTLSNGMTVWLNEDPHATSVLGLIVVRAGGKETPNTGIAHYFEHLMFKGTETIGTTNFSEEKPYLDSIKQAYTELKNTREEGKRKEIQKRINELSIRAANYAIPNEFNTLTSFLGGSMLNAGTTYDYTMYHNYFPAEQLGGWLQLNSERFLNPVFRLFQSELETVYEEKNMYSDSYLLQIQEQFHDIVFSPHPYSKSLIGSSENLKNPDLEAMIAFYKRYYIAENMALILSGNFSAEEIIPLIEKSFSRIPQGAGSIEEPVMQPNPFIGKEEIRFIAPIPIIQGGATLWRTVGKNHPDEVGLELITELLTNSNSNGLFDKLVKEKKVYLASGLQYQLNDAGLFLVVYVPKWKIFGFNQAEKLISNQMDTIILGSFSDHDLENAKKSLLKEKELLLESQEGRVFKMVDLFVSKKSWETYIEQQNKLALLTKEEVSEIASRYFTPNKLVLKKKYGLPHKEEIAKPAYQAIHPKKEEILSPFGNDLLSENSVALEPSFIDFEEGILQKDQKQLIRKIRNPYNSIFKLEYIFPIGKIDVPSLESLSLYLSQVDSKNMSNKDFQTRLAELGSNLSYYTSNHYFTITLTGYDTNFAESTSLLNDFLSELVPTKKSIEAIITAKDIADRTNSMNPLYLYAALNDYILFGKNSFLKQELSSKELKNISEDYFPSLFDTLKAYKRSIIYTGQLDDAFILSVLNKDSWKGEKVGHVEREKRRGQGGSVFFMNSGSSKQSIVSSHFLLKELTSPKEILIAEVFKEYMGGGMSSVLFQEIREFRSIAYLVQSMLRLPYKWGKNQDGVFSVVFITQNDKTVEAIQLLDSLISNIQFRQDRFLLAKQNIRNQMFIEKPSFRIKGSSIEKLLYEGYELDPDIERSELLNEISLEDLIHFHSTYFKKHQRVLALIANEKKFRNNDLEKFGLLIKVQYKDLQKKK